MKNKTLSNKCLTQVMVNLLGVFREWNKGICHYGEHIGLQSRTPYMENQEVEGLGCSYVGCGVRRKPYVDPKTHMPQTVHTGSNTKIGPLILMQYCNILHRQRRLSSRGSAAANDANNFLSSRT